MLLRIPVRTNAYFNLYSLICFVFLFSFNELILAYIYIYYSRMILVPAFLLSIFFPLSTQTLNFVFEDTPIQLPTDLSTARLTVNFVNLPILPDIALLNETMKIFFSYPIDNMNSELKILITSLKKSYKHLLTQLATRSSFFNGKSDPWTSACFLDIVYMDPSLVPVLAALSKIMASLSPTVVQAGQLNDLSAQATQTLLGTITPLWQYFLSLSNIFDLEQEFYLQLQSNILPPYVLSLLPLSTCLSPSIQNNYQIISFQSSSKGPQISILVTQILKTRKYIPLHSTPFFGYFLNISNTPFPAYKTLDNSLIYFPCSPQHVLCPERQINDSCLSALQEKKFTDAKLLCNFIKGTEEPILTKDGILVPNSYQIDLLSPLQQELSSPPLPRSTKGPTLIQSASQVKLTSNNREYTFQPTLTDGSIFTAFYLNAQESKTLLDLLTPPPPFYTPSLAEKITWGVASSIVSILFLILAIFTKFNPIRTAAGHPRPNVVFRIAASRRT